MRSLARPVHTLLSPVLSAALLCPALLSLPACVPATHAPAPPPPAMPVATPPPPVVPVRGADWRDWPLSPGTWVYTRDARGSIARFGMPGQDATVSLRCDAAARAIYLSRAGTTTTPLTIRTSTTVRSLTVQPTGATPAYVATTLAAGDGLLDAMGFSRGRFVLEQTGVPPLVIPAWAEIERVTEDCRG